MIDISSFIMGMHFFIAIRNSKEFAAVIYNCRSA